jgi:hypothetical protein
MSPARPCPRPSHRPAFRRSPGPGRNRAQPPPWTEARPKPARTRPGRSRGSPDAPSRGSAGNGCAGPVSRCDRKVGIPLRRIVGPPNFETEGKIMQLRGNASGRLAGPVVPATTLALGMAVVLAACSAHHSAAPASPSGWPRGFLAPGRAGTAAPTKARSCSSGSRPDRGWPAPSGSRRPTARTGVWQATAPSTGR